MAPWTLAINAVTNSIPDSLGDLISPGKASVLTGFAGAVTATAAETQGVSAGDIFGNIIEFGANPVEFILGILLETFIGGILNAAAIVIEQLEAALEPVVGIPMLVATPLLDAGELVVEPFLAAFATLDTALTSTVAATGPFAPVIVVGVYALLVVVGLWVLRILVYEGLPILYEIIVLVIPWA